MTRFLVDAQLPVRLVRALRERGFDAIHTSELPQANATPDSVINALSLEQARVVVSKDSDFSDSFVLRGVPHKLLLVSMGNLSNKDLEVLFLANLERISELFQTHSYVELGWDSLVVHV